MTTLVWNVFLHFHCPSRRFCLAVGQPCRRSYGLSRGMRKVLKKPSGRPILNPGDVASRRPAAEVAAPRPEWAPPPTCCTPPWPSHFTRALQRHGHLPLRADTALELSIWSDCSGINSEMFALKELRRALREEAGIDMTLNLYFTCGASLTRGASSLPAPTTCQGTRAET